MVYADDIDVVFFASNGGNFCSPASGGKSHMADPILDVRNVSKSFGALRASNNVLLTLTPGKFMR